METTSPAAVKCPRCGSDQLTANKKGFSNKKALTGAILTGGIGLLAGNIGSNKVIVSCMNCGYSWCPADVYKEKHEREMQIARAAEIDFNARFKTLCESKQYAEAEELYFEHYPDRKGTTDINEVFEKIKNEEGFSGTTMFIILTVVIIVLVIAMKACQ